MPLNRGIRKWAVCARGLTVAVDALNTDLTDATRWVAMDDTMGRFLRVKVGMLLLVLTAAACSSGEPASKAGGEEPPLVLEIGTNDFPGRVAAEQIEKFAETVAKLSEGLLLIEPVWRVGGENVTHWDQEVSRQVVSGELDMGNIPSRAFDTQGVTSLRALNAPFLITTDELLDEVVSSDLVDEMLSGLEEIGLVGLALLPEGLRHPFGFGQPLMGVDDYAGGAIRAPSSATTAAIIESLGGIVVEGSIDPETQIGMESSYPFGEPGSVATGNVVFFPKVNTLVMNAEAFERLTDTQREILEEAAAETLQWSIESRVTDFEAAARFCDEGGAVVLVDEETLAGLEEATAGVYEELEPDPLTVNLIEEILELKRAFSTADLSPETCGEVSPTSEPGIADTSTAKEASAINGVYRWEFTEEAFETNGVTSDEMADNIGVWTNTFQDGLWIDDSGFRGTYLIEGDLIKLSHKDGLYEVYRWEQNGRGDLVVEIVDVPDTREAVATIWTAQIWVRVGETETADFPEGTFRVEHTVAGLMDVGVSEADAYEHAGLWTATFEDGKLLAADGCTGKYAVSEGRMYLYLGSEPGCGSAARSIFFSAEWTFDGDLLQFENLLAGPEEPSAQTRLEGVFASSPWEKID